MAQHNTRGRPHGSPILLIRKEPYLKIIRVAVLLSVRQGWTYHGVDLFPSSERGTTEGASSYPAEASRDGFLRTARSVRPATEQASLYLTEESEDGLTTSNSAEQREAETVSPQQPETSTNGFVPLDDSVAEEIEILDGLEFRPQL
jgi:hypothetical protein